MTPSGPTRLLAAVAAVAALALTAPAYAGGSPRAGHGADRRPVPQPHAWPRPRPPATRTAPDRLPHGAQRPGHRGPRPAEGRHLRRAERRREAPHDGRPPLLPGLPRRPRPDDRVRDRYGVHLPLLRADGDQQRSSGARWLRCDLTIRHGRQLGDLPTDRVPALTSKPASREGRALPGRRAPLLTTIVLGKPHATAPRARSTRPRAVPRPRTMLQIGRSPLPRGLTTDPDFRFTWSAQVRSGPRARPRRGLLHTTPRAELSRARPPRRRGRRTHGPRRAWRSRRRPRR